MELLVLLAQQGQMGLLGPQVSLGLQALPDLQEVRQLMYRHSLLLEQEHGLNLMLELQFSYKHGGLEEPEVRQLRVLPIEVQAVEEVPMLNILSLLQLCQLRLELQWEPVG